MYVFAIKQGAHLRSPIRQQINRVPKPREINCDEDVQKSGVFCVFFSVAFPLKRTCGFKTVGEKLAAIQWRLRGMVLSDRGLGTSRLLMFEAIYYRFRNRSDCF